MRFEVLSELDGGGIGGSRQVVAAVLLRLWRVGYAAEYGGTIAAGTSFWGMLRICRRQRQGSGLGRYNSVYRRTVCLEGKALAVRGEAQRGRLCAGMRYTAVSA